MNNFVYALHGFLGTSEDWNGVLGATSDQKNRIVRPSYFKPNTEYLNNADKSYCLQKFESDILENLKNKKFNKKIFMGYSLGGRLGLHLLKRNPDLFDAYIFISTHPGLENDGEKDQRLKSDLNWVHKLNSTPWSQFLDEWNNQSVFRMSSQESRLETDYSKELVANSLRVFSLGVQQSFEDTIERYKNKISWVVGDRDIKFLKIAEDLKQKKTLLDFKRVSSGHRILFDNSESLRVILQEVLRSLS